MTGELILTSNTYNTGRITLNDSFSGTATFNNIQASGGISGTTVSANTFYVGSNNILTIITTAATSSWSASTGSNSIIANNGTGNLASGNTSFAMGKASVAGGAEAFAAGNFNTSLGTSNYTIGGSSNIVDGLYDFIGGGFGNYINNGSTQSAILGGQANSGFTALNSAILGGDSNSISGSSYNAILAGQANINKANTAAIIGGSANTISSTAIGAIVLGMSGFTASSAYTAYMAYSYIDQYLDMNPITTIPAARAGRMFYSAGTLNRMILFTASTLGHYMVMQ